MIRYQPNDLWLEFPFSAEYRDAIAEGQDHETVRKTSEKTSEKIVSLIRANPAVTIAELAESTGRTTRAVEMQLAKLKEKGMIERVGPDKGGHWVVKEQS